MELIQAALGAAGVYLHGSAALGGFRAEVSDVDLLVLSRGPLSAAEKSDLIRAARSVPCPAKGLDLNVATSASAREPSHPPAFELDVWTPKDGPQEVAEGLARGPSLDFTMHFAICRERGVALLGPEPRAVFAPIPRPWLLEAFASELEWDAQHAAVEDTVLNSCRAWRYLEEGELSSKEAGGEWALDRLSDPRPVEAALAQRRGASGRLELSAASEFARRVENLIAAEL